MKMESFFFLVKSIIDRHFTPKLLKTIFIFQLHYNMKNECALYSLISFFILKLGKIVIVKEGKLSMKMESFFILFKVNRRPKPI